VATLRGEIEHHPYRDIAHHLEKMNTYTDLWARQAHRNGRHAPAWQLALIPAWTFFRNFVLRRGFVLGAAGFTISRLNSFYSFLKIAKLRDLQRAAVR
jgi:hypothetical protein